MTVLFCDMVGFTKLAYKLDPETLQIVLRTYEEACATCVNRYEGYVFTTLGDGIVAFFGFPLAHEAEAERAVRAGLDIVDGHRATACRRARDDCRSASASPRAWSWSPPASATRSARP